MSEPIYRRREFVGAGVGAAATLAMGAAFWKDVLGTGGQATTAAAPSKRSGYGP